MTLLPRQLKRAASVSSQRNVAYGSLPEQRLDIYLPNVPMLGAIMLIHGGVTVGGDKLSLDSMASNFASTYGVAAMSINYRGVWPGALQDCQLAVRWFRKKYGALKVVPYGFSRGAQMAAWLNIFSQTFSREDIYPGDMSMLYPMQSPAVSGCITDSAPVDLTEPDLPIMDKHMIFSNYDETGDEGLAICSPIHHDVPGGFWLSIPKGPWYVSHGYGDEYIPFAQAELLVASLEANGVSHKVRYYEGGHCMENLTIPERQAITADAAAFAVSILKY